MDLLLLESMKGFLPAMCPASATFSLSVVLAFLPRVLPIDCYMCTSFNENNKLCEDKFKRDKSTVGIIQKNCIYGYFKATYCVKLKAKREDGSSILVRHCSDSDWGRHCGDIWYSNNNNQQERINGCLYTCDTDGCNVASSPYPSITTRLLFLPVFIWMLIHIAA